MAHIVGRAGGDKGVGDPLSPSEGGEPQTCYGRIGRLLVKGMLSSHLFVGVPHNG